MARGASWTGTAFRIRRAARGFSTPRRRLVYPADLPKVRRLLDFADVNRDVADPWYTGNFDETYADIIAGCTALLQFLPFVIQPFNSYGRRRRDEK